MRKFHTCMDSPVGRLTLVAAGEALVRICFPSGKGTCGPGPDSEESSAPFAEVVRQLSAYFRGELRRFELTVAPEGTRFQQIVWEELRRIPYGETISYAGLARRIGKPEAVRAVGGANARNPIPIVIPCHRVVGSNGELTGFGGGLDTKAALLALERRVIGFGDR